MSKFKYKDIDIHYEVYGEGKPLLILNGIMMSCLSWNKFIGAFEGEYKLILIDFIDQGQSGECVESYTQSIQVEMLNSFIKFIAKDKVNIMGISYGGEVAMKYTAKYGETVDNLILANTTARTSNQLKEIGNAWIKAAETYDSDTFFEVSMPGIYSSVFFEEQYEWLMERKEVFKVALSENWYDRFVRLVRSAEEHDAREDIKNIKNQTLVISAELDQITPVSEQVKLASEIEKSYHVTVENAGHALMYEKPLEFVGIVKGFLSTANYKFEI